MGKGYHLLYLPDELLLHIIGKLEPRYRLDIARVNCRLINLARESLFKDNSFAAQKLQYALVAKLFSLHPVTKSYVDKLFPDFSSFETVLGLNADERLAFITRDLLQHQKISPSSLDFIEFIQEKPHRNKELLVPIFLSLSIYCSDINGVIYDAKGQANGLVPIQDAYLYDYLEYHLAKKNDMACLQYLDNLSSKILQGQDEKCKLLIDNYLARYTKKEIDKVKKNPKLKKHVNRDEFFSALKDCYSWNKKPAVKAINYFCDICNNNSHHKTVRDNLAKLFYYALNFDSEQLIVNILYSWSQHIFFQEQFDGFYDAIITSKLSYDVKFDVLDIIVNNLSRFCDSMHYEYFAQYIEKVSKNRLQTRHNISDLCNILLDKNILDSTYNSLLKIKLDRLKYIFFGYPRDSIVIPPAAKINYTYDELIKINALNGHAQITRIKSLCKLLPYLDDIKRGKIFDIIDATSNAPTFCWQTHSILDDNMELIRVAIDLVPTVIHYAPTSYAEKSVKLNNKIKGFIINQQTTGFRVRNSDNLSQMWPLLEQENIQSLIIVSRENPPRLTAFDIVREKIKLTNEVAELSEDTSNLKLGN